MNSYDLKDIITTKKLNCQFHVFQTIITIENNSRFSVSRFNIQSFTF